MFNILLNSLDFSHKYDAQVVQNKDFTKHMHSDVELLYFISGKVLYSVDTMQKKLIPFDTVLILPGQFHYGNVDNTTSYERYVFKFPYSLIPLHLREKLKETGPFIGVNKNLITLFNSAKQISEKYSDLDQEVLLNGLIKHILIDICNDKFHINEKHIKEPPLVVVNTLNYIEQNITKNITLNTLSNDLHFSCSYLSNAFFNYTNISIIKYIKTKKMIKAREDIISGKFTATEAAALYGFIDYSSFYRNYIKFFGHSPTKQK